MPLDSIHNINSKLKDMYNLLELETAGKLLLASQLRADGKVAATASLSFRVASWPVALFISSFHKFASVWS